jgi:hypothetical protein
LIGASALCSSNVAFYVDFVVRALPSQASLLKILDEAVFTPRIDALLRYNDFQIEHTYDSYNEEEYSSDAWKQPIIWLSKYG